MAYSVVESLLGGVDRTRPIYAVQPGSLWSGINGHLTRGGDFEQRKAFVQFAALPTGTFGLERASSTLYTFGSQAPPSMPPGVLYQRLQHPDGLAMTALLSTDAYAGRIYAVAQYSDGTVHHFYDGTLVTDWVNGVVRASMTNNDGIAAHMQGLMTSTEWAATVLGSVITVTHGTVNTAFTTFTTFVANVEGGVDDQTFTALKTVAAAPAVAEVWTITVAGTFEAGDRFGVTIKAATASATVLFGAVAMPYPAGRVVKTHGRKMYAGVDTLAHFSGVDDARLWNRDDDAGAGFIDAQAHESDSEEVIAFGKYLGYLCLISANIIQIWDMRADDTLNVLVQSIAETGTIAPRSVRAFGELDMFYLSESGIRSLRTRSQVALAGVNDVGTPIDLLVRETWIALSDAQRRAACAVTDPADGRFWMAVGSKIFVFTYFPSRKVSGWSWYEPGFSPEYMVAVNRRVYLRTGNTVYVYGGTDGETYDACAVTCQLPFMGFGKPGTSKQLHGIDIAAEGRWTMDVLVDPNDLTQKVQYGEIDGWSFMSEEIAGEASATHFAPKLTRSLTGPASVSAVAVYYTQGNAES